jgi:hypothetical protein
VAREKREDSGDAKSNGLFMTTLRANNEVSMLVINLELDQSECKIATFRICNVHIVRPLHVDLEPDDLKWCKFDLSLPKQWHFIIYYSVSDCTM